MRKKLQNDVDEKVCTIADIITETIISYSVIAQIVVRNCASAKLNKSGKQLSVNSVETVKPVDKLEQRECFKLFFASERSSEA